MNDESTEVVFALDGVVMLRHPDGSRELRLTGHVLDSLEAAFDAIVAAVLLPGVPARPAPSFDAGATARLRRFA